MNEERNAVSSDSGAQKKAPNRRDSIQISFRVNEHDYAKLKESADNLGMSVTAFAKMRAQNARIVKPKFDKEDSLKLISELNRIGNNINQIAMASNMRSQFRADIVDSMIEKNLKEVQRELAALWQQLN
jgi:hypothetical protein